MKIQDALRELADLYDHWDTAHDYLEQDDLMEDEVIDGEDLLSTLGGEIINMEEYIRGYLTKVED